MDNGVVSASDWAKGIGLSVVASVIGGASKLAIRKSWLIQNEDAVPDNDTVDETTIPEALTLNCGELPLETQVDSLADSSQGDRNGIWFPYLLRYSGMFGMSVLNPICCVLAMNYASPSILAPFSGLTLVWVILLSYPVVGERPSNPQVVAASLIIAGEVIVAVFGDHTNDDGVTIEDVKKSYRQPAFVAYLVGLTLYISLLTYWIFHSKSPVLRRFSWGCCGGAITGLQNFLKDSLTIIKATPVDGHYPWFFPIFPILAGATAFIGLLVLTACMKRYDATYSAASFVGSFVISASIMSAAHYNTFALLDSVWNYVLYPTGLVVLMIGVYMLVRESREPCEEDSDIPGNRDRKNSEDSQAPFMYTQVDDESTGSNGRVV